MQKMQENSEKGLLRPIKTRKAAGSDPVRPKRHQLLFLYNETESGVRSLCFGEKASRIVIVLMLRNNAGQTEKQDEAKE